MSRYRRQLPQLNSDLFLTDGGLETDLVFHHGYELKCFAAFTLLEDPEGEKILHDYFCSYVDLAREYGMGLILESVTWRASLSWGKQMGYSSEDMERLNARSIEMLEEIRDEYESESTPMVISGCIGPRGDGYDPKHCMSINEAECYHFAQAKVFSESEADMISAYTIPYTDEAIGIVKATRIFNMPCVISFTVETDGRLPNGMTMYEAIEVVDEKTEGGPVYYMINCAHPSHMLEAVSTAGPMAKRIKALRANASCKSHAELDEATELDEGNPVDMGREMKEIINEYPQINIVGGCCGTDIRHIREIAKACGVMV